MNTIKDAVIVATAGAGVLWFSIGPLLRVLRATRWPRVEGVVEASNLEFSINRRTPDFGSTMPAYGGSNMFVVRYAYVAEGKNYTNDRRRFAYVDSRREFWSESWMLRHYPVGKKVMVRYDPADPSFAVLSLRLAWWNYFIIVFGALMFAAGASGLVRFALQYLSR